MALLVPGARWPRWTPARANLAAAAMPPQRASGTAGVQDAMATKNLPPPAACREAGFEMATSARRVHRFRKAHLSWMDVASAKAVGSPCF